MEEDMEYWRDRTAAAEREIERLASGKVAMSPIRQGTAEQLCDLVISFAQSHKALKDALTAVKQDEMACHSLVVWAQIDAALAECQ